MAESAKTALGVITGILAFPIFLATLLVLALRCKAHKVVIASSPLFLAVLLIGLLMLCGAVLCIIQQQTTTLCYFKYWLFNIGASLVLGSLVLKTWRLHKIFNQTMLAVSQTVRDHRSVHC